MSEDLLLLEVPDAANRNSSRPIALKDADRRRVAIMLFDGFSLISLSSAIEVLHVANRALGKPAFDYSLYSPFGQRFARSGSGIPFEVDPNADAIGAADFFVVCSGDGVENQKLPDCLKARVRRLHRDGIPIAAIGSGAIVLADIGLLDHHRCAVHRNYAAIMQELFPEVQLEDSMVEIDRRILTSAGGISSMELMISYIRNVSNPEPAALSAMTLDHDLCAGLQERQLDLRFGLDGSNQRLSRCIRIMEENIERPLRTREIARRAGMSTRSLQRLFQRTFGEAPTQCYQKIRLDEARRLVRQTSLPMMGIAMATGFSMASRFSKKYRAEFGISPRQDRMRSIRSTTTL